jgi:LVIVD repeat
VRRIVPWVMGLVTLLSGCSTPAVPKQTITHVTPSSSGIPNSVASFGDFEFVSVQGTGQIFSYNISSGSQELVGIYTTPCNDPSGMVITTIAGNNVMAAVCYDTGSLLTLTVHANGALSLLGTLAGLAAPYPGIASDGTDVFVPLFGQSAVANGGVARVSIASPANPVITGTVTLASPATGGFVNPGYLAISGGDIFVAAGSESSPIELSSTIQVVDVATMTLVGSPMVVAHSPQQIAVQGSVAYVTLFDATQLESIDISNPARLKPLQIASIAAPNASCHALPVAVRGNLAYVGCYAEGVIDQFDISDPSNMHPAKSISGVAAPQRLLFAGNYLLVPGSVNGGQVYQIDTGATTSQPSF